MKTCSTCNESKALTEFYKQSAGKYGVGTICKECKSIYNKKNRILKKPQVISGDKKMCSECKEWLPMKEEFYRTNVYISKIHGDKRVSYNSKCKRCVREVFRSKYRKIYGITKSEENDMFKAQRGVCAICGNNNGTELKEKSLCIDHDHKTGKIRGLLCDHCNTGLGKFRDNEELMRKAIKYLLKNR